MELIHPICCGLDVHQAMIAACLRRVQNDGTIQLECRIFGTMMRDLMELSDWLTASGCPLAAMESTGVYWKPVYHVLAEVMTVWVVNPKDIRQRRGQKTDQKDAKWIAELLAHSLIQPSFVPPPEISALRDLMRTRTALAQTRTQTKNRILGTLEDTNIKLSSVATDPFGVSGRQMLEALVAGERNPEVLADMAKGVMRRKIPELREAMIGGFTEHHALLIRANLAVLDTLELQIKLLEAEMERVTQPMQVNIERLISIPGVKEATARVILSEIGTDMERFGSAERLASWAGLCPGDNKTGGKRKSGKTRKGNRYLRRVLAESAWAAYKTDTFLGRTFRRLQARIGGKKAALAVGHKILVIAYHLLFEATLYDDGRYDRANAREEERRKKRAIAQLEMLGYQVALTEAAVAA